MERPGLAQRSYFQWGLKELQRRLDDYCEAGYSEYEVIEMFIHEMNHYACMNRNTPYIFSCAADAGEYVLNGTTILYL